MNDDEAGRRQVGALRQLIESLQPTPDYGFLPEENEVKIAFERDVDLRSSQFFLKLPSLKSLVMSGHPVRSNPSVSKRPKSRVEATIGPNRLCALRHSLAATRCPARAKSRHPISAQT
jgi:hypothetical protein